MLSSLICLDLTNDRVFFLVCFALNVTRRDWRRTRPRPSTRRYFRVMWICCAKKFLHSVEVNHLVMRRAMYRGFLALGRALTQE